MGDSEPTRGERLAEIFRRLANSLPCSSADEAYRLLCGTIDAVEDELTETPNEPANFAVDGRIYPPQDDNRKTVPGRADLRRYVSRGHNTLIGDNGAITILDRNKNAVFTKPGLMERGLETMNPIERIQADLIARFPDIAVEIDPPATENGYWNLDVRRGLDYLVSVEWREVDGFAFSTPKDDDLWSAQDERSTDYGESLDRISDLIASGGETTPPPRFRLAELRQARGLSQAELAKRAGLAQPNLSRTENSDQMRLSTLKTLIAAMGGTLGIVARFPDGSHWELQV